jgi:SAM-dependent methyltransferase
LFESLREACERPRPYCAMTIADLWTEPYVAEQMQPYHLDGSRAIASETTEVIEAGTDWMVRTFNLGAGRRVLDLGCGPGLWTTRLARAGARVTGVDFSARSLAHARETAAREGLGVTYLQADYLSWEPDGRYDLVTMIMRDYGAMNPDQRLTILRKVERILEPAGRFVFDVDSMTRFAARREATTLSSSPRGDFWSPNPYFELCSSFVYPAEAVSLDKHTIVEADRTRRIYNWVQYFSPASLREELEKAGLVIDSLLADVTGRPYDPESEIFAVAVRRRD